MLLPTSFISSLVIVATLIVSCDARRLPHSVMLHRRAAFTFAARPTPRNWPSDSIESYDQYNFRSLVIGCQQQKTENKKFYKACCHPRTSSDALEKMPVECHISPESMLAAQQYILKSTKNQGYMSVGRGTPVQVTQGSIEVMKPVEGRSAYDPPTPDQVKEILAAQAKVQSLNEQSKANASKTYSTPTDSSTTDQNDKAASEKDSPSKATDLQVNVPVSSLAGISQVYGQDGDAKGTFFYQEGAAGACGNVNSDSTPLVALPTHMYDGGVHCGKSVMIKNTANGKTVVAKVQDMCPGCPSSDSLDLSTGAYDALGSEDTGVLSIQWGYI
ncbi:hypothetical protein CROQUDRAFT_92599 [Cronartium quercuum f. sp. fusiforme G11]|uniref:RlpA-like protein double-psi beta-barrel domain-containing protein n=1 Tax=Cronartium quercuum f. sp. fusiforme G11 TaxID=708437 RepID=A0A9P6NI76_9BASI|nr:hypothetical protein CROQUDRAFT_92599 [Cronartium quercuum f. sp. fusiforme G11]